MYQMASVKESHSPSVQLDTAITFHTSARKTSCGWTQTGSHLSRHPLFALLQQTNYEGVST